MTPNNDQILRAATKAGFKIVSPDDFTKAERLAFIELSVAARKPDDPNSAIVQFAVLNGIDIATEDGFTQAENGAKKKYPEVFGLVVTAPTKQTDNDKIVKLSVEPESKMLIGNGQISINIFGE